MEEILSVLVRGLMEIVIPASVFLGFLIGGYILRKALFSRLSHWTKKTSTNIDDIIIHATRGPFILWCIMLGIYFVLKFSNLPQETVHISNKLLLVLGIVSVTLVAASISSRLVKVYSVRLESALPVTSLTQNITRIVIFGIGILILLNTLGISVTPILATLGIGGLAVALALQDTLSSLFAGFHIIAARQVKVGDYIKLESGEEGYVVDINWRTIKIRMLPNNMVLVPNEKLTKSIITNYCLPDKEMAVLVNLGVHYESDLVKVEKITCEVAQEIMNEVTGGVPNFQPFIRYHTFDDFSINFTVILRAKEFVDQYLIKHEFVKRLHERYKKEGIVIPYPIRAINYTQEKAKKDVIL
ncbi:MAG: mechanosensitive ion channel family protein [bacterium]|nr:mechanosensitive ion channel family protein [bacterium]